MYKSRVNIESSNIYHELVIRINSFLILGKDIWMDIPGEYCRKAFLCLQVRA